MSGGYRSFEGVWIGGVSGQAQTTPSGYRSLMAFWLGGASQAAVVTPTTGGGALPRYATTRVVDILQRPKKRIPEGLLREDEEIIIL